MGLLTFYGASDDLIEFEGAFREEFYLPQSGKWCGRLHSPNGDALRIYAEFDADGSYRADWSLAVENTGTWPSWPMHYGDRPDRSGDPALFINVPEGTIVEEVVR